jgi:molybdate transport system substrate-binding protein
MLRGAAVVRGSLREHLTMTTAIAVVAALLFAAGQSDAAELKVMVTGSMAAPLREIAENFARKHGHTAAVTAGITTTVTATLQAGETADLVEVTSVGMDQLARENLIRSESRVEIARALIGLAVREGAAVPGVSTQDAVARLLRNARTITYVNPRFAGQVGTNMMTFLDRAGVREDVVRKAALAFTGEEAVQKVAKGEADIVIAFVSEIIPVRGVKWLGPLPTDLQVPTSYSAAIGAGSANPDLARALLDEIASSDGRRVIAEAGLEPVAR